MRRPIKLAAYLLVACGELTMSAAAQETAKSAGVQPANASDWPLFRGNGTATGVAKAPASQPRPDGKQHPSDRSLLPDQPELLWTYTVENSSFETTPIVAGGVAFLGDLDGGFHAIDIRTGKAKWKTKQEAGYNATAAWRDGRIYVGDIDGVFHCLDASSGDEKWQFKTAAEIDSAPNFYDGNVLFGSQDGTLYALNAETGKEEWRYQIEDQIRCSPTIVEGRAFLAGCDGKLHIIDVVKGEKIADVPIESPTGSTPAALGDMVYFGTEAGTFFGIDWKKQEIKWELQDKSRSLPIRSSAAATPDAIIFAGRDKLVRAVNPETGKELWTFTARRGIDSSPVVVGGRVYFGSGDGRIYGLNRKTKAVEWQYEAGGSFTGSAAVAAGRLVIANTDGNVYCFGAK